MNTEQTPAGGINVSIGGDVSGQIAIGSHNTLIQRQRADKPALTEEQVRTFSELIERVKKQVSDAAPPDKKQPALERVGELEQALTGEKPDLSTIEYVRNWFAKNIPQLAGIVTSLVVHPVAGKLVEAAGETFAHEFKRRLSE
jgi:hypothetical protein